MLGTPRNIGAVVWHHAVVVRWLQLHRGSDWNCVAGYCMHLSLFGMQSIQVPCPDVVYFVIVVCGLPIQCCGHGALYDQTFRPVLMC